MSTLTCEDCMALMARYPDKAFGPKEKAVEDVEVGAS
jgi:hypothetical protein